MNHRDPLRVFAWCCVLAGVVIAASYTAYASYEMTRREETWFQRELRSENVSRLRQAIRDVDAGFRPAWVIVSPWPGMIAGACVGTLGIILLAIRHPAPGSEDKERRGQPKSPPRDSAL